MRKITSYIANDGAQFNTRANCAAHERTSGITAQVLRLAIENASKKRNIRRYETTEKNQIFSECMADYMYANPTATRMPVQALAVRMESLDISGCRKVNEFFQVQLKACETGGGRGRKFVALPMPQVNIGVVFFT